ncbi:spore germination protein GerW family protein [Lentzea kentuckyensis]|uniref:spore germination protein GerW family protein n=1 Tax=Lentzea kentuckyensis TaxID=360086 RepID=UPI000A37C004|nr:spore germination protein GerW family protein [Lentzea kentuckyensis]
MKVDELISKTKDTFEAKKVYAEPFTQDGITVIAAATVSGGLGGGTGRDEKGQEGEGGGFGVYAKPTGAYVISDGKVRWEPAIDANRLIAVMGAVAIAAMLIASRIVRAKARGQA